MSIVGSIGNRVEITLGLTVASRAVAELAQFGDTWTLLKGFIALSVILSLATGPTNVQGGALLLLLPRREVRLCSTM
jgi:hypothetical protein